MPITQASNRRGAPHFALNRARREKRLSIQQLADEAGVEFLTIQRIELGLTQNPWEETKHKIADALGTDVFDLWP